MKLVYIVGCTHNGSTLLGRVLNQHERVFLAGELQYLDVFWGPTGQRCSCGVHALRCPVWGEVFWKLVDRDLRRPSYARLSSERPVEWVRALTGAYSQRRKRLFPKHNRLLLEALSEVTGADVLIDSSKSVWRLLPLWRHLGHPVYVVHLIRTPEAQVASRLGRTYRSFWRAALTEYFRVNVIVRLMFGGRERYRKLRYEDFVADPEGTVRGLFEWIGLGLVDPFSRDVVPPHDLGGNPWTKRSAADLRPDPTRAPATLAFHGVRRWTLRWLDRLLYQP